MNKKTKHTDIVIYQAKSGALEFRGDFREETIWATQAQIVDLFDVDQSVVSRHIRNVFNDQEIDKKSNMQKMHNANSDKPVTLYSLDVVLAVGYRTNSKVAVDFRKWATSTLRTHIIEGYTINRARIGQNYGAFMEAVQSVRALLPASNVVSNKDILELISVFADTWFSLNAFDKGEFAIGKPTKKKVVLTADKLGEHVSILKHELLEKGEASDIFASERTSGALEGIVGNVMQAFGGKDVYPSVEEKAAHLLYFIVKNHPFIDGNKRTGAYAFVWLLSTTGILDISRITPSTLTAITLLIAESNPADKDKMVNLVTMLLTGSHKKK